ncbi:hypothetical protein OG562_22365 [Streptomyces sp. NBC_01275]|uniref:hypothetical protein n=1 Tax=Streptomyces sp. NBC_01275 TaxID=2903807 RepID=UPI00224DA86B|nr:hypothetical protein [Streptomyces sp. NBC_01275]MCX4763656.1 hypothetical protein [Streptomyces sp. NBC_01275]
MTGPLGELSQELPPAPPPGAMELATVLSIATRIEPELIREVRLRLLPHLDVGAEADLWFCDWVGARTPEAVALLPECLPYLRAGLVDKLEKEPRLREIASIVSEFHHDLSPALLLEEQVTWDSLSGNAEGATQHLNRALHSLVRENRSGLAGWFAEAQRRLPSETLSTATAWSLANAARPHVPSLDPGTAPELTLTTVSSIASAVGEAPLGVLREGRTLLLGKVRGRDAAAVLVPDTSPRVVEITAGSAVRTVRVDAAEVVRLDVGTGPVGLRTGAGQVYVIDEPAPATPRPDASEYEALSELIGPDVDPELAPRLTQAIRDLRERYHHRAGKPDDLLAALALATHTLETGYELREFPELGCEIAETLYLHGLRFGSRNSLERAVGVVVLMTGVVSLEQSMRADTVLGAAQRELFHYTGDLSYLHQAVDALATREIRLRGGTIATGRLISELLDTYVVLHTVRPRENALRRAMDLMDSTLDSTSDRETYALSLARVLVAWYEAEGDPADLDRAEILVAEAAPPQEPRSVLAERASVLASVHLARFWRDGSQAALHAALRQSRSAVKLSPERDIRLRPRLQHALSDVLRVGSAVLSEQADLDEAVTLAEQAARSLPTRSVWRMTALISLNRCLLDSFRRTGDVSALDLAVDASREVVSQFRHHPDLPYRHTALVQQGECLVLRYRATGDSQSLSQAIESFRSTREDLVALGPADHLARTAAYASALLELHTLDSSRTDLTGALAELDSLLQYGDGGIDRPLIDPESSSVLLARAAFISGRPKTSYASLRRAADRAQEVAVRRYALPLQRLWAGLLWGSLAVRLNLPEDVVQSYETVADLLPLMLLASGRDHADIVRAWEKLSGEAAACAIEAGAPERALEFLEQRSVLLSAWRQESPVEVHRLRGAAPDLVAELRRLWALLHLSPRPIASRIHRLQASVQTRLDQLVTEMRAVPGFGDFLAPVPAHRLVAAASEGPVVVLSTAARRCDALLVTRQGVSSLPLPELSPAALKNQTNSYRAAMSTGPAPQDQHVVWQILEWLDRSTVGPVLSALGLGYGTSTGIPYPTTESAAANDAVWSDMLPRMWWCPTSPFTMLPLHLAGQHSRSAMDYAVHSYTSSLQALTTARTRERHSGHQPVQPMLLVLADDDLPYGAREIDAIHRLLPHARVLRGTQAAGANVAAHLADHPFFHFVGRARLHEGVPQLGFGTDGADGALAYLSVRESNGGDQGFESDGWTLATAFQTAGFDHVIGLPGWSADAAVHDFAHSVYVLLLGPDGRLRPEGSARALHQVVRTWIAHSAEHALAFAAVVHLGP